MNPADIYYAYQELYRIAPTLIAGGIPEARP